MGYENTLADGKTANPNLPTKITAGSSDYAFNFLFSGTANEMFFFRTYNQNSKLQLDCNVNLNATGSTLQYGITIGNTNSLTLGSTDYNRTFVFQDAGDAVAKGVFWVGSGSSLISNSVMTLNLGKFGSALVTTTDATNTFNKKLTVNGGTVVGDKHTFVVGQRSTLTFNDELVLNSGVSTSINTFWGDQYATISLNGKTTYTGGATDAIFRGKAAFIVNGDFTFNSATTTHLAFLSGGTDADKGSIAINGKLTVNGIPTANYFDMIFLNGAGQSITTGKDSVITMNTTTDNGKSTNMFVLPFLDQTLTIDGDVVVNHLGGGTSAETNTFRIIDLRTVSGVTTANQSAVVNGDITIKGNSYGTMLSRMQMAGQSIVYNGNVTITSNTFSESIMGVRENGTMTTFAGKIDTTSRTAQSSFGGGAETAVVNFKGKVDNTFHNLGLRTSIYNLMNTNNSAAVNATSAFDLGGNARINIFGEGQLKVLANTKTNLFGAASNGVSGTINLNGTSLDMGKLVNYSSKRLLVVDFGMADNGGMTAAQMAQAGITAGMINATGAGTKQVFSFDGFTYSGTDTNTTNNYVLFKNYVVGEDSVLSYVQLSTTELGGVIAYSDSDLSKNVYRFEGYMDATKYGKDKEYYLAEIETTDAYGSPCWEYAIVMVPEPSTYAALFGVLALAFCVSRRSKKN